MSGPNDTPLTGEVKEGNPPAGGGGQDTPEAKAAAEAAAKAAGEKEAADVAKAQEGMTDEQKAADNKARAEKKEADKKAADEKAKNAKADGAPEAYVDFTMPEGIEVDKGTVEKFGVLAKELNLSQEKAQKLVDLQTGLMKAQAEEQVKAWETTLETWKKQGEDDKEIGGASYEANKALANSVIAKFGLSNITVDGKTTQSIKPVVEALAITGAANHPEILRFLVNVGKAIGEDKLRTDRASTPAEPKTLAQRMFGTVDPPAS